MLLQPGNIKPPAAITIKRNSLAARPTGDCFFNIWNKIKLVEAVGIEPTPAAFPLAGFVFIGVHYKCIEVHISMLFN
jgi:hypothetical protein